MILYGHIHGQRKKEAAMISDARAIIFKSRPHGKISADNFEFGKVALNAPAGRQVLVKTEYFSVDPYMRNRMNDVKSYVEPYAVGQPVTGDAVGRIVESGAADFRPGDRVVGIMPWQEYAVMAGDSLYKIPYDDILPCYIAC